ncbi:unnamed protein product [Mytilus coruscus]|uniref:Uncharacterized protein n=1 Tax=Mytilus coruscus TaxID=42192 RepID=A0A6J8ALI3_MYTCO|nr:unnamed protein product [Mytilus coruscus]
MLPVTILLHFVFHQTDNRSIIPQQVENCDARISKCTYDRSHDHCDLVIACSFSIICILLLISGIEPNPGPLTAESSSCSNSSLGDVLKNAVSFMHHNIQSIVLKLELIAADYSCHEILSFTESWLSSQVSNEAILLPGYKTPFRRDRFGKIDDDLICEDTKKAKIFNDYFCSQSNLDDCNTQMPDIPDTRTEGLNYMVISENEVADILKILDVSKASGPDRLSPRLLKEASVILKYPLCRKAPSKAEATQHRFHTARLKDPTINKKFTLTLRNKFQVLGDIGEVLEQDVESTWKDIKDSYTHACRTVLGTRKKNDKK